MYLYYLLGWKLTTKYFSKWGEGGNEAELKREFEVGGEKSSIMCLQTQTEYFCTMNQSKLFSVPPEREAEHLPAGFRWRHGLPASFCDAAD